MADNIYRGEPMYSRDVCQLMRDINSLQSDDSLPNIIDIAYDGSDYYMLTVNHEILEFNSSFAYQSAWRLDTIGSDDTTLQMRYGQGMLWFVRIDRDVPGGVRYAEAYTVVGVRARRFSIGDSNEIAVSDDHIYAARFIGGGYSGEYRTWTIDQYLPDGTLVNSTSFDDAGLGGRLCWASALYMHYLKIVWMTQYDVIRQFDSGLDLINQTATKTDVVRSWSNRIVADGTYLYLLPNETEYAWAPERLTTHKIYTLDPLLFVGTASEVWDYFVSGSTWNGLEHKTVLNYVARDIEDGDRNSYSVASWTYPPLSGSETSLTLPNSGQTRWYAYAPTAKTDLGDPDSGVSVPELDALTVSANPGTVLSAQHLLDMRAAVESLAPNYTNSATTNAFNWTDASADNLYYVAMGDRSNYGATGGARYDWTRTADELIGSPCYDIDIGEIYECVEKLKASDPV